MKNRNNLVKIRAHDSDNQHTVRLRTGVTCRYITGTQYRQLMDDLYGEGWATQDDYADACRRSIPFSDATTGFGAHEYTEPNKEKS